MNTETPDTIPALRRQLDACTAMLRGAMDACDDKLWDLRTDGPPVWEQLYHTLFWLDAWARDWSTPLEKPRFHVQEALDMKGDPPHAVSRGEMRGYFDKVAADVAAHFDALTPTTLFAPREAFGKPWTPLDRILGQIRHVQHHAGYLNAVLRRGGCAAAAWIGYQE